jgi:exodeoxyribonuclease VII large subunit
VPTTSLKKMSVGYSAEQQGFAFDDTRPDEPAVAVEEVLEEPSKAPAEEAPSAVKGAVLSAADLRARLAALRTSAKSTVVEQAPRRVVTRQADNAPVEEPPAEEEALLEEDDESLEEPESLSIAQFYERVRRALSMEFTDEVWVTGEIRSLRESRGHHYLELADHDAPANVRGGPQMLEVVCWARDWPLTARLLAEVGLSLEEGQVVRVRGRVSVWEGGGRIRFSLTSLDIANMLGQIAQARRRLLHALGQEGLLDANRRWALPLVPLRIGLVTSQSSEAHRDFLSQLEASGYAFVVHLEPSFVQGPEAPGQLVNAIRRLENFEPDIGVIVRGGGARGDLAAFDHEQVARAVANASFPIWTGIGHTGDRSVVDEVAHQSFITPTACAKAVVARVDEYWSEIGRKAKLLRTISSARLDQAKQRLTNAESTVIRGTRHQLTSCMNDLQSARSRVARVAASRVRAEQDRIAVQTRDALNGLNRSFDQHRLRLESRAEVLRAYDPSKQLARGWSLTRDSEGRIVRDISTLHEGARLRTNVFGGDIISVVESTEIRERQQEDLSNG